MMVETLKTELKIDKSSWKKVKFGEVVSEPKENTQNIIADGFQHIVGLEHIDSGDIHLRKSFAGDTDTTFTKVFRKGDVLFGRRRAYLKKAALADFDGVCSGDITVFRAKKVLLLPELLPFIVNNDHFFDYAVKHSAGGLSPRVKFKDLANYEFLLPPKEEQQRLAELLWAMDEVIEKEKKVLENIEISKRSLLRTIYNQKADLKTIKEVCEILDNRRIPLNQNQRNDEHGKIPYYGANGLAGFVDTPIFDEKIVLVAEDGGNFYEFHSKPISYVVDGESWVNNHAHVLKFKDEKTDEDWLFYQLVHRNITKHITGTTRLKLTKGELEKIKIWMPSYSIIQNYLNKLNLIYQTSSEFNSKLQSSQSLQKSLINQIF